ncbi:hypothetical protein [Shimia sp. R9_3]|uniref:hypothetical protein n=1 Tax=Shimia sp. R9_3 TaxID=2821113 RepID=UPI001ADBDA40|nr:hypothetical protein [Shimia sp. R9_3]MBO9401868.1 hypothetical protein [Shimia sp. R9_3]
MRILIATMQRVPYAAMAVWGLSLAATILFFEIKMGLLAPLSGFGQQVLTGCLLLGLLGYQWVLFAKRVRKDNSHMRQNLTIHRWVGVAATFVFALHAVRFGHVWMTGVSTVFFFIAVTGVFNRTVLGYRKNWMYLVWLFSHIGLSAALFPLVGVHIWVALAYQ